VAAVKLPRVANFDDLDPLRSAGAEVDWVERPSQLGRPDLIVLPGSKNTAEDLAWLHANGLGSALVELADRGTPVLGLCGGYQMLGELVADPDGVESSRPATPGLGLLPLETILSGQKTTRQTQARLIAPRGLFAGAEAAELTGYEIHLGQTTGPGQPLLALDGPGGPHPDGRSARSGWIVGTYLHGLLHNPHLTRTLLHNLATRNQPLPARTPNPPPSALHSSFLFLNSSFALDRLADHAEASLDLPGLFALVGLDHRM
jgi:adenosylcobyric acid synthase